MSNEPKQPLRLVQERGTSKPTTVRLLSHTQHPLETVYCMWKASRTNDRIDEPGDVAYRMARERVDGYADAHPDDHDFPAEKVEAHPAGPYEREIRAVFQQVVDMKMPLGESIYFTFLVENMPVALREQMVRHRIGHKFGDQLGADWLPDVAGSSSFWSQTTRIINMGDFADAGDYYTPPFIRENADKPTPPDMQLAFPEGNIGDLYAAQMKIIQDMYNDLVKAGVPLEDARNVLPVAMQHRMTWTCNLSSITHVLSRRGCWLAQLGMWEPVIRGIVEELSTKVDPIFRRLIDPPCFDQKGDWAGCAFKRENEEIVNKGEYPPCSLWINKDYHDDPRRGGWKGEPAEAAVVTEQRMPRYIRMQEKYATLWRRDPRTGERTQVG